MELISCDSHELTCKTDTEQEFYSEPLGISDSHGLHMPGTAVPSGLIYSFLMMYNEFDTPRQGPVDRWPKPGWVTVIFDYCKSDSVVHSSSRALTPSVCFENEILALSVSGLV